MIIEKSPILQVDINGKISYPLIEFTEGDTANYLIFNITKGGNPIDLTAIIGSITFEKPDGTKVVGSCYVENNQLVYKLGTQEITVPGTVIATIEVYEGLNKLTSPRFQFNVQSQLDDGTGIESSTEYPILTAFMSNMQNVLTVEQVRTEAETQRQTNEVARQEAEGLRVDTFNTNETDRESVFDTNETNRINTFNSNESARANTFTTNETSRTSTFNTNETARQNSETTRINSESNRVSAELARSGEWSLWKSQNTMMNDLEVRKAVLIPVKTLLTITRAGLAFNPLYSYSVTSLVTVANDTIVDNGMTKDTLCYYARNQLRGTDSIIFKTINEHILNGAETL